jgi:hypothetical protein
MDGLGKIHLTNKTWRVRASNRFAQALRACLGDKSEEGKPQGTNGPIMFHKLGIFGRSLPIHYNRSAILIQAIYRRMQGPKMKNQIRPARINKSNGFGFQESWIILTRSNLNERVAHA